jgi:mannose/cellobiose epimerase-like protein (N-acyl-D-glucosamine 2-epimerase family)
MSTPFRLRPDHHDWLRVECRRLLDFGRAAAVRDGFGWLDRDGALEVDRGVALWITCRMTHSYALGALSGLPGCGPLADPGLAALDGRLRDRHNGGWHANVPSAGADPGGPKSAYDHAFVVLAAATGTVAGRPRASALLEEALEVLLCRFWDDDAGMVVDNWDTSFTRLDPYRGVNGAMHTVEAFLAAADATGDRTLLDRALRVVRRVVHDLAPAHGGRIPEHFDTGWQPLLDEYRDQPAHPFRPYGATVGHSFEWARLAVQLAGAVGQADHRWLVDDAAVLFATAVADGWAADGADGFVYTVDWDGVPVVRERMHWVAAEAVAAAAALHAATGDPAYDASYATWWDHIDTCFRDPRGSWWHELSPSNQPSGVTWSGKPDLYHAVQATLIPVAPLAVSVAAGVRDRPVETSPEAPVV